MRRQRQSLQTLRQLRQTLAQAKLLLHMYCRTSLRHRLTVPSSPRRIPLTIVRRRNLKAMLIFRRTRYPLPRLALLRCLLSIHMMLLRNRCHLDSRTRVRCRAFDPSTRIQLRDSSNLRHRPPLITQQMAHSRLPSPRRPFLLVLSRTPQNPPDPQNSQPRPDAVSGPRYLRHST